MCLPREMEIRVSIARSSDGVQGCSSSEPNPDIGRVKGGRARASRGRHAPHFHLLMGNRRFYQWSSLPRCWLITEQVEGKKKDEYRGCAHAVPVYPWERAKNLCFVWVGRESRGWTGDAVTIHRRYVLFFSRIQSYIDENDILFLSISEEWSYIFNQPAESQDPLWPSSIILSNMKDCVI